MKGTCSLLHPRNILAKSGMTLASIRRKRIPVFRLPLFPASQESLHYFQEDLRNPLKQGSLDSAPLPQGSFPQAKPLDREDKAGLPPLGNSSFMFAARPTSVLSNLPPPGKWGFPPKSFSLSGAQLLAQEKDLQTAIASLSLNM